MLPRMNPMTSLYHKYHTKCCTMSALTLELILAHVSSYSVVCCIALFLPYHTDADLKSGNFHGALSSISVQHADPLVPCMCESHVELQGKEVCGPLVWMKRMSSLALRERCSSIFFLWFSVVLCIHCCVIHSFSAVLLVAMQLVVF